MAQTVLNPGDILAERYKLVEEIGRGGFGVVYRAIQLGMNRDVAVKILHGVSGPPEIAGQTRERFRREAMMARNLNHPNTIRQYDFGETEHGLMYLVLEYLDGLNLVEVIRAQGALGDDRVRKMAEGCLKSLSEAHAQGIVHRDLKPGNIMLCNVYGETDYVKLLDFGIAKTIMGDTDLTAVGVALGSPRYMSPEILRGENPGPSSDVYAIGITFAEAITAKPLLPAESSVEAARIQLDPGPLPIPDELRDSSLWSWLSIALQKDPKRRYQNAEEMLQFLNADAETIVQRGGEPPKVVVPTNEFPPRVQDDSDSPTMRFAPEEAEAAFERFRLEREAKELAERGIAPVIVGNQGGNAIVRDAAADDERATIFDPYDGHATSPLQESATNELDQVSNDDVRKTEVYQSVTGMKSPTAGLENESDATEMIVLDDATSPSRMAIERPGFGNGVDVHGSTSGAAEEKTPFSFGSSPAQPSSPFVSDPDSTDSPPKLDLSNPAKQSQHSFAPGNSPVSHAPPVANAFSNTPVSNAPVSNTFGNASSTPGTQPQFGPMGGLSTPAANEQVFNGTAPAGQQVSGQLGEHNSEVKRVKTEFLNVDALNAPPDQVQTATRKKSILIVVGLLFIGVFVLVALAGLLFFATRGDGTDIVVPDEVKTTPDGPTKEKTKASVETKTNEKDEKKVKVVEKPKEKPVGEMVTFEFESTPGGAKIFLRGKESGTTPAELTVDQASLPMPVILEKSGYEPRKFTLRDSSSSILNEKLKKLTVEPKKKKKKKKKKKRKTKKKDNTIPLF